jgi:hypothetical protein
MYKAIYNDRGHYYTAARQENSDPLARPDAAFTSSALSPNGEPCYPQILRTRRKYKPPATTLSCAAYCLLLTAYWSYTILEE